MLEYLLSPKGHQQGSFHRVFVSGEEAEFLLVSYSCTAHGAPD